jgi:orotidine-5'-phosphate decarboxylase
MPLLVPGIGAQGGDIAASVSASQTSGGTGIVINSSRAILYAGDGLDFASEHTLWRVRRATVINRHRRGTAARLVTGRFFRVARPM